MGRHENTKELFKIVISIIYSMYQFCQPFMCEICVCFLLKKYLTFLKENSEYYKYLNRSSSYYDKFIKDMKVKYHLRTIDKVDSLVDSVDLITKIINISNDK